MSKCIYSETCRHYSRQDRLCVGKPCNREKCMYYNGAVQQLMRNNDALRLPHTLQDNRIRRLGEV